MPEVLAGQVEFLSYQKGTDYQYGEINVQEGALLRLPLFDFPGMEVSIDGQKVAHVNNDCRGEEYCFGLIAVPVTTGKHFIKAQLKNTPIRTIGDTITLGSFLILIFLIFKIYDFGKH